MDLATLELIPWLPPLLFYSLHVYDAGWQKALATTASRRRCQDQWIVPVSFRYYIGADLNNTRARRGLA